MKLILILLASISLNAFAQSESVLCDSKTTNQLTFADSVQSRDPSEISVITWNAHKFADANYFNDVKRLSETTDILLMQEAMHSTGWQAAFASHIPMSFSFHKSFCDFDDQATGVMTMARYPLENSLTITSKGVEPGLMTPKVSGYSKVVINNREVHLINTHALNFNIGRPFENQIDQLVEFISKLQGPVIWAGDFNTWSGARQNYLNAKTRQVGLTHLVPMNESRLLILDHIYVRGFTSGITEILPEKTSDHAPIRTVLRFID